MSQSRRRLLTIVSKLETCTTPSQLNQAHALLLTTNLLSSPSVASRLLTAFSSSPKLPLLFSQIRHPDTFCYNIIIKAYAGRSPTLSLAFYKLLLAQHDRIWPNEYTFCFLLGCCRGDGGVGRQVHGHVWKHGVDGSGVFVGTSLVCMYGRCGAFRDARFVFDGMPERSGVTYGTMVDVCLRNGRYEECLGLFREMGLVGVEPSNGALVGLLQVCGDTGRLAIGKVVHGFATIRGLELNVTLGTCLVDMYFKCGDVEMARRAFAAMPVRNVVSWNCMINGLARNGCGNEAVGLLKQMQALNVIPNDSTFVGVLNACNHAGLVNEGADYLAIMSKDYNISPNVKHYGCVVDLYGRAGRIQEAMMLIRAMPVSPDYVVWVALLSACKMHGYKNLGEAVGAQLTKILSFDTCGYLLLSEAFALSKHWEGVAGIRKTMVEMNVWKIPGQSSISK